MRCSRFASSLIPALVCLSVGCRDQEPGTASQVLSTWVAEPEFRFGNTPEGLFLVRPYARVDPLRNRVLVLDGVDVSAWTPTGDLLFVVGGRGDGPGEFRRPGSLFIHDDGSFTVPDQFGSRMTRFSANGELLEAELGPGGRVSYQGFPLVLASSMNGIFLGHPSIPADLEVGMAGAEPMNQRPVLRVRESEPGNWQPPEPLLWMDVGSRTLEVSLADGSGVFMAQPFGDWDEVAFEPGAAVVVRRNRGPGVVDLIEVSVTGDTVWHRRLQFEPRQLTAEVIEQSGAETIRQLSARRGVSVARVRAAYYEALYRPDYIAPVSGKPVLAASGDVWLASTEAADTLTVYHVVGRGTTNQPLRRVLLPQEMFVTDATSTHVWGVMRDEMDTPYIVGRRLVEWNRPES